ncbi:hypothetical protein BJP36_36570 [Moorena producens JHB]|uniref:Uncharacterized protein n=1 Tax=Moorena producens (strain JHB) TaxID=1454205 RepID=A0A9Q9STY4_MOOP1|nr:hypothetical protein [Moorena producens]WAN69609.1 hypothetical protein BJP36_36570 [Moorena producens JHB]
MRYAHATQTAKGLWPRYLRCEREQLLNKRGKHSINLSYGKLMADG